MNSKDQILARVRRQKPPEAPLPDLQETWITYPDRQAQFIDVLKFVGGAARVVARSNLAAEVAALEVVSQASSIVCAVPGLALGNLDLATVADPHALENVDVAIAPGEFAVAENGAVWVSGEAVAHRAILFLAQYLVLVVPIENLIEQMHEAYERLRFDRPGYGVFISGPSKTADIEQSLVIGAHGPRSLTVMLTIGDDAT